MEKLKEFLDCYKGFDYENGEVVIVDQRQAQNFICKYRDGDLISQSIILCYAYSRDIYKWTHTEKTMLIII